MPVRNIPLHEAAIAAEMIEQGYSESDASRSTGLNRGTVHDIVNGVGHWARDCQTSVFMEWRQATKREIMGRSSALAVKLLAHAEKCVDENPEKTSPYQAVGMYGILRTHDRLDAGEATVNVAVSLDSSSVEALDKLAQALSRSLLGGTVVGESSEVEAEITQEVGEKERNDG